jgi:nitrogen regulatory protein P-II 1
MSIDKLSGSQLKKVEAEVRKERFPEVDFALKKIGVPGLTVVEERSAGRGMWSYPLENIPHLLLTVVVDDVGAKKVVESIRESGSTRSWGDGRIVVSAVDDVLDIGSGRLDRSELTAPPLRN